jgi:hypothetical protein
MSLEAAKHRTLAELYLATSEQRGTLLSAAASGGPADDTNSSSGPASVPQEGTFAANGPISGWWRRLDEEELGETHFSWDRQQIYAFEGARTAALAKGSCDVFLLLEKKSGIWRMGGDKSKTTGKGKFYASRSKCALPGNVDRHAAQVNSLEGVSNWEVHSGKHARLQVLSFAARMEVATTAKAQVSLVGIFILALKHFKDSMLRTAKRPHFSGESSFLGPKSPTSDAIVHCAFPCTLSFWDHQAVEGIDDHYKSTHNRGACVHFRMKCMSTPSAFSVEQPRI